MKRMECSQCQMLAINGVACHETGCPIGPVVAHCSSCDEALTRGKVYRADDWSGLEYCQDCAEREAQYQAEQDLVDDAE